MNERNVNEMEQFRKKMKRKRRKRLVRLAFLSLLITVLICAVVKLVFSVSSVTVSNPTDYETEQLINTAQILPGRIIFTLTSEKIEASLQKNFPYIKSAKVDIKLPSTIAVSFTEGRRAWRLESEDGYIYLSDDMVILEKSKTLYGDTVRVSGMDIGEVFEGEIFSVDDSIEFRVLRDIIKALDGRGMRDKLTLVDFTKKYNTKIFLGDRVEVELGTSESISEKVELMLKILDRNSPEKKLLINVKNPEKGRCRELGELNPAEPEQPPEDQENPAGIAEPEDE